jgi:hypothetical protein
MRARAPARTPPQVSSVVFRDDNRLECLIVFVPSRATTTVSAVNPCALRATTKSERLVLARDEHVSRRNAKPRLVASARHPYNFHVRQFNSEPQSRRGINNGPKPLKKAFVVGRLRRFLHVIAITAAAITSAAAVDSPEISLMNTLLLWDEGGIAFGDLTFRNRPAARHRHCNCRRLSIFGPRWPKGRPAQADGRRARVWPHDQDCQGQNWNSLRERSDDGLLGSRLQMGELATITGTITGRQLGC